MDEVLKFSNGDSAVVHSTNSWMDGMKVCIIGVANDFRPASGSIYIVEGITQVKGWDAFCLTESCLMPVES